MRMSEKFCNILVMWGPIWQLWMLLSMTWRWQTILDCKTARSPDTLWRSHWVPLSHGLAPHLSKKLSKFPPDTLWSCLHGLKHSLGIHAFRLTWPCLIIKALTTPAKFFETFGYCTDFIFIGIFTTDMPLGFLHVKLGSPRRTLNWPIYLIHRVNYSNSINYDWVQVLSYSKYSLLFLPVIVIEPGTCWRFHSEALSKHLP